MALLRNILQPILSDVVKESVFIKPISPVTLTIDYVATQFDFKFKAPIGKTLDIYDGDGTLTQVAGNDASLVTHTTSYSEAGTYYFYVEGDYLDLTYLRINGQSFVSGDISRWNECPNLTYVRWDSTSVTGDISGYANLTSLTAIRGHVSLVHGDVGKLSTLTSLTSLWLYETNVTFDSISAFSANNNSIRLQDCVWTSAMTDNALSSFVNLTGCYIDVGGNSEALSNASRTSATNSALLSILAGPNNIAVNDAVWASLGVELHTNANASAIDDEADAVTGFTSVGLDGTGNNKFESQDVVKVDGLYAIYADSTDTPIDGARFYADLQAAPFGLLNGNVCRISFKSRHSGNGDGTWGVCLSSTNSNETLIVSNSPVTETEFNYKCYYWTHDANHRYLVGKERTYLGDGAGDGGLYFDNLSIKKVTLP